MKMLHSSQMELETMSAIADIITGLILLILFVTLFIDLSKDRKNDDTNVMDIAEREHQEVLAALKSLQTEIEKLRLKDWD